MLLSEGCLHLLIEHRQQVNGQVHLCEAVKLHVDEGVEQQARKLARVRQVVALHCRADEEHRNTEAYRGHLGRHSYLQMLQQHDGRHHTCKIETIIIIVISYAVLRW